MQFIILLSLWLSVPVFVVAQTISGKIQTTSGEKVAFANITVKDSIQSETIKEFAVAKNGGYAITLAETYTTVVLEVSTSEYQKGVFIIPQFDAHKNYTHDFVLLKDTIVTLREVVIKNDPFQIRGDTVTYNVSAYRDGTERKIQDLIKKLPGIEVNENSGQIRYKGKPVETVKLDGEDLFSSNYTIGTKNINVDMIEEVQAIENYSDNPLLKGIESGDKVALNLTLKKQKTDYSGNTELGLGILGNTLARDIATNILGIAKKYKSFATASYNNVGINNTPFDYFANNPSVEQVKEYDLFANKYIPDTYFNTDIDEKRSNINQALFTSYNATFKMGKKINTKTNLYYFKDKLTSQQLSTASNTISGQTFTTSDSYTIIKKPTQLRGDFEVKYNGSKKSLLEYVAQLKRENINTSNEVLQNNTTRFNTSLSTKDDYLKQVLTYTAKLSPKKALQLTAKYTSNDVPQQLSFTPAIVEPQTYTLNQQKSGFGKNNLILQSTMLGSTKKSKYTVSAGSTMRFIDFHSDLRGIKKDTNTALNGFQNTLTYTQKSIFLSGNYKLQVKRFKVNPAMTLSSMYQQLETKFSSKNRDTNNLLIEPNLAISYKLNSYAGVLLSAGVQQKTFSEDYFVQNQVYVSNRMTTRNDVSLQIQQSKNVGVSYFINNLYRQFQLNIGVHYSENRGNYFSNLLIQQNNTLLVHFFLPEKNELLSSNFLIEKYVPFLQATVRLSNNYSKQSYKNIVNASSLRNNETEVFNSTLFFKTAFDGKVNFGNTVEHQFLQSKVENGFQISNQAIKNSFQLIIKPAKRVLFFLTNDYFLPNTSKKQQYLFFDTNLNYETKNKVYYFGFKVRNLTNNKTLNQFNTNDYSINNFQTNLLARHFILSVSRKF